ncbi:hypothetical protein INR49_008713 [Caranx melampygus]|nr:hypothetical protein INR49_008713 [Caranx melampygus]
MELNTLTLFHSLMKVYKFLYACRLFDCGLTSQAFHYCEVVGQAILRQREPFFVLTGEVIKLADRLTYTEGQLMKAVSVEPCRNLTESGSDNLTSNIQSPEPELLYIRGRAGSSSGADMAPPPTAGCQQPSSAGLIPLQENQTPERLARDANAGTTIGYTSRKLLNVGGFMVTSEASGVVQATFGIVGPDSTSLLGSFLNGSLNIVTGTRNMSLLEPSDCGYNGIQMRVDGAMEGLWCGGGDVELDLKRKGDFEGVGGKREEGKGEGRAAATSRTDSNGASQRTKLSLSHLQITGERTSKEMTRQRRVDLSPCGALKMIVLSALLHLTGVDMDEVRLTDWGNKNQYIVAGDLEACKLQGLDLAEMACLAGLSREPQECHQRPKRGQRFSVLIDVSREAPQGGAKWSYIPNHVA